MAFGRFGGMILAIPVLAGILTGMNGFFMATTRLLFSMGRGKFLHPWFLKVHPKYGTPTNAVLFTLGLTLIAPFLRPLRPQLDRRHVRMGTALASPFHPASLFTSTPPRFADQTPWWSKSVAVVGALTSIACFLMLAVPGSPAAIGFESWLCCSHG